MHVGCVLYLLNRTDCYVWNQAKELVTVRIQNALDQSLKVAPQIRAMCTTPYTLRRASSSTLQ